MTKKCKYCAKVIIDPKHPNRQYCGFDCFAKIREGKPRPYMQGEKHPLFGTSVPPERRKRMSISRKRWLKTNDLPWTGKKRSKANCEKMSKIQKERNKRLGPEGHSCWKGGKTITENGYVQIMKKDHPFCSNVGYVFEHRLVMEKKLGRYLKPEERIHHINHKKKDNRIENLMLFANEREHQKFHGGDQLRN